ncbi:cation transporter [Candidatus Saccharibacteria bacterium]|nr:cation transporter [Candidatus Saccharibacteria bacterium]
MHSHDRQASRSFKFVIGFILNTGFTVLEFVVGIMAGSLALVSDASHNLTDSLSIAIAFGGERVSSRQANDSKSYGFGRVSIVTALINGVLLFAVAAYIFYEAYLRILNPEPVKGGLVAIVALAGILINGVVALLFYKDKDDLNVKSTFLNMAFDTLSSVGAMIAGLIILVTGNTLVDPIIGILIGCMLVFSAYGVVRDALHILLEGTPKDIDSSEIANFILSFPHVKGVDDLHIWSISSHYLAMSCHIVIEEENLQSSVDQVKAIKKQLLGKYQIQHATIETELKHCEPKH